MNQASWSNHTNDPEKSRLFNGNSRGHSKSTKGVQRAANNLKSNLQETFSTTGVQCRMSNRKQTELKNKKRSKLVDKHAKNLQTTTPLLGNPIFSAIADIAIDFGKELFKDKIEQPVPKKRKRTSSKTEA